GARYSPESRQSYALSYCVVGPGKGFGRIDNRDLGDKTIPASGQGLNITRILGGVPQGSPEFCDGNINSLVEIAKAFLRPNAGAQLVPGDHLSRMFQQDFQ